MNINSIHAGATEDKGDPRPILVVPYMWIGDFVRGHTVVRILKQRWPNRPIDLLATSLCAPLADYMPGVRSAIVWELPRGRLALAKQRGLARHLRGRNYGTALVLPGTWKSAIAPALAGIPERVGFFGEARFGLLNRLRWGERALPRFIDKNASLALPEGAPLPAEWPCGNGSNQNAAALRTLPADDLHHERTCLYAHHSGVRRGRHRGAGIDRCGSPRCALTNIAAALRLLQETPKDERRWSRKTRRL